MKHLSLIVIMSLLTLGTISCSGQKVDNSTVKSLDLDRYLGRWYEIARYDHSFERNVEFATANYSLMKNGKIMVINSGMKFGDMKVSTGKAKTTAVPGILRVSFFGPFYSDYRVLMLSDDYQYAIVGSKSPKFLWILSRTPQVPYETLELMLDNIEKRGYKPEKLIWVSQTTL